MNAQSAQNLINCGVIVIDVAGRGGTRCDDMEIVRHPDIESLMSKESIFSQWGYSTVESLTAVTTQYPKIQL